MIKLTLLLSLQYDGKSALMLASENGYTENVKHLVEAMASLDLQSEVSWPSNPYSILCCAVIMIRNTTHHCFINSYTLHFNFTLHAKMMRHVV